MFTRRNQVKGIETSSPSGTQPLIPARMLNEFVYCPRLGHLMWVEAEFAESAETVEGKAKHGRVDKPSGSLPKTPTVVDAMREFRRVDHGRTSAAAKVLRGKELRH